MMDLKTAITILGVVIGFCIMLSLGGLLGSKKIQPGKIYRALIIIVLIGVIVYIVFSAWYLFASAASSMADLRIAIALLGALVACCGLIALGVHLSRSMEVTRVYITSGVIALLALIIFVIYAAFYLIAK